MDSLFFHPKVVHLPIALAVLLPPLAAALALAWWRGWLPRRAWLVVVALQAALVLGSFVAVRSGEAEEERIEEIVAERHIETHEEAAEGFAWFAVAVLALAAAAALAPDRRVALALAAVTVLGTGVAFGLGYRVGASGGALAYEHGAACAYARGALAPAGASPRGFERGEDDDD